jgi:hypothetical protein
MEKSFGEGAIRICQVKLVNRTKTNPSAALFARRLLSLDCQAVQGEVERQNGNLYNGVGTLNGSKIETNMPVLQAKRPKADRQVQTRSL